MSRARRDSSARRTRAQQGRKRAYLVAFRMWHGCSRCGYGRCADALQFHHRDPAVKDFAVMRAVQSFGWPRLRAEVAKCVVVCANCHAELHAEERATRVPSGTTETVPP